MTDSVLVVLTNWKRPENLARIIPAMQAQTYPVKIVVVDNSMTLGLQCLAELTPFDDVWRFRINAGPPCRFAPALIRHDCRYVLFYDDDLLPGSRMVENLIRVAGMLEHQFATIGQIGRFVQDSRYVKRNVKMQSHPVKVDITCRAHFVRAESVHAAIMFKWALLNWAAMHEPGDDRIPRAVGRHDDLLLAMGIQWSEGVPSYLIPKGPHDILIRCKDLPAPHAACARPEHVTERDHMIQVAESIGWRSWR